MSKVPFPGESNPQQKDVIASHMTAGANEGLRYVGLFDVLGLRSLILQQPLNEVVEGMKAFIRNADDLLDVPGEKCRSRISVRVFQDTVVVVSTDDSPSDFEAIVMYCCALVNFSFNLQIIPLRGAIAKGQVYMDETMVIGEGIVKVYEMEQQQDWFGCWVAEDCLRVQPSALVDKLTRGFLFRYRIPMKSGPVQEYWALNWTICMWNIGCEPVMAAWRELEKRVRQFSDNWDVRRKIKNTDTFLSFISSKGYLRSKESVEKERASAQDTFDAE